MIDTSDRAFEDDSAITGFGLIPEKPEGSPIVYDDPLRGYEKRYVHKTYGMGFQVTWEMVRDDQYRKMMALPRKLGLSLRETLETLTHAELINGFDGAAGALTGPDGKSLFATDHPLVGGGTAANRPSTEGALSLTTLEQAIIDINNWVDNRGLKINIAPRTLIIPPSLQFSAKQLLNSTLLPGSPNNDVNPIQSILNVEVDDYVTDGGIGGTNPWFIRCDDHQMWYFWRTRPVFDRDGDFETLNMKFKIYASWSHGWTDWRGWYGNDGAA
jgi:hypothetical protein